jgi:hypothetical protein
LCTQVKNGCFCNFAYFVKICKQPLAIGVRITIISYMTQQRAASSTRLGQ